MRVFLTGATGFVGMSASRALTRERLGWQPTQPGLLADIDRDAYFAS